MKPPQSMQIKKLVLEMGNEDEQVISYVNNMHSETVILLSLFEGNRGLKMAEGITNPFK